MAAAVVVRGAGVSSRAHLTGRHRDVHGGRAPNPNVSQKGGNDYDFDFEGSVVGKLDDTSEILSKGDLVREITERMMLQREMGTHNGVNAWILAGLVMAGYAFGRTTGTTYEKYKRQKLKEEK